MLVLTRKCLEAIVVGGANSFETTIKVTILGIRGGKVRLGIDAADGVPVHRLEVWERVRTSAQIKASKIVPTSSGDVY